MDESAEDSSTENRSSTVCHLCRQRKVKCDRSLPKCGFCIKSGAECQYVRKTKKPGLRAGYVTELETKLSCLEAEVANLRRSQRNGSQIVENTNDENLGSSALYHTPPSATDHIASPSERRRLDIASELAATDLASLPRPFLLTLADIWFKETHTWCPILNQQQIRRILHALPNPIDHINDVVLRALFSFQIAFSSQALLLGYDGRYRLSQRLRISALNEAMADVSYASLQALLIIALLDYGLDNLPSAMHILAICRRMSERLGLFQTLLNEIEIQGSSYVQPPNQDIVNTGGIAVALTWSVLELDSVITLGTCWRDVSASFIDHLSSVVYVDTPELRNSHKARVHVAAIGFQPLHGFIYDYGRGLYRVDAEAALTVCEKNYQNLIQYLQAQPATSYTVLADGMVDFDPNLVHTRVLANTGIISQYQLLVEFGPGIPDIPLRRCLDACEDIIMNIRNVSDADTELNTPLLGTCLFIAARFKLVVYRALSRPREANFDTLMHSINMCGRRWLLSRRIDITLRAAIDEVDGEGTIRLPREFWDLKRSHNDISEALKTWVESQRPSLFAQGLNGPYSLK